MYPNNEDYPTYEEREARKNTDLYAMTTVHGKARYLLNGKIWAHYWRARIELEEASHTQSLLRKLRGRQYYPHYQLDIDHYTNYWLAANGDREEPEVIKYIADTFGYKAQPNKFLPKGYSIFVFGDDLKKIEEEQNDNKNMALDD